MKDIYWLYEDGLCYSQPPLSRLLKNETTVKITAQEHAFPQSERVKLFRIRALVTGLKNK